jgi:hypothetical protein
MFEVLHKSRVELFGSYQCWLDVMDHLLIRSFIFLYSIRCGPDEERILDVVPREDGARNSG